MRNYCTELATGLRNWLGGRLSDVVRTRIFISDVHNLESIASALGERFKDIQPANTMVKAELIGSAYLVETEAEALID
jgi:enamine deaminase RidA (YjgF/YER057c/UK114 family)